MVVIGCNVSEDQDMKSAQQKLDYEKLTVPEKILYLQDLWDKIAEVPDEVEITDAQREELDRRLKDYEESPDEGSSWEEVRKRVRS